MNDEGPQTATAVVPAIGNHVGLTTPDMFATIDFYESVLGFRLIMGPRILELRGPTAETGSVFGPAFHKAYQAHLLSANGFGIELFQFLDPPVEPPDPGYRYTRPGCSHLCLTVPDVGSAVQRVVAGGGERLTEPAHFVPGRSWELAYCRDPWGTVIELMSASYAEVFANWPQPGMRLTTRMLARDGTEFTLDAGSS